jgi:hypothetical protein
MKRIGELEYRNMGTFAKMFLFDSGKALVVGSGLRVEPYSGMVVNVPSGVCFQRSVDVILPCLEPTAQVVTVQAADGTPRTDIIEAQVKVVSDKSDTVQVMSVPSGSTSIVTLEEVKRDMRYYLSARAQKGTTTPTPATAAELTGTVAIATTIDLTEKYLLNLCNGEDGDYQEIDLRGSTPSATTRAEIIALINAAVGYTMASTGTGNVIVLTGEGTGQSSYFAIQPPVTDADKDALEIVFGVSAGGAYRWPYVGDDEWFKLAEIDVGASTTDLTDTEIRNIDEKSTWSDGDDVLLMYHANEGRFDEINEKTTDAGVTIEGVNIKDGIITNLYPGWHLDTHTWEYVSADAPTYVFRINADATGYLYVGQKIKYTQTTTKYGIITAIGSYSGGYTNITIYGGGNTSSPAYAMSANAITNPYYATTWRPLDFPMNPDTWSYIVTDVTLRSQSSLVNGTLYNLGSISIAIPIGSWDVRYKVSPILGLDSNGSTYSGQLDTTLSTSNNSESDNDFRSRLGYYITSSTTATQFQSTNWVNKILNLVSKTTYYLLTRATAAGENTTLYNDNANVKLIIKAICQYL